MTKHRQRRNRIHTVVFNVACVFLVALMCRSIEPALYAVFASVIECHYIWASIKLRKKSGVYIFRAGFELPSFNYDVPNVQVLYNVNIQINRLIGKANNYKLHRTHYKRDVDAFNERFHFIICVWIAIKCLHKRFFSVWNSTWFTHSYHFTRFFSNLICLLELMKTFFSSPKVKYYFFFSAVPLISLT